MGCEGSSPPSVDPGVGMLWKHIQALKIPFRFLSEAVGTELFGCQVFFSQNRGGRDGNETFQELQRKRRHTHTDIHTDTRENDGCLSLTCDFPKAYISFLARSMGTGFGNLYMVAGLELSAFHMTAMLVSATEKLVGLQERNHGVTRLQ